MSEHSIRSVAPLRPAARTAPSSPPSPAGPPPAPRDEPGASRIVVVDDGPCGGDIVRELRRSGYEADLVTNCHDVIGVALDVDLLVLRWGLDELHSAEVCRCVRAVSDVGIVAVGGTDSEMERVLSLHAGADDHLTSPYGVHELLARIQAVLRRCGPAGGTSTVDLGELRIDRAKREARVGGRRVELTRKEFDLLWMLASRPDTVVTREELMLEVWNDASGVATRTIDTHVSTLRSKLGPSVPITTTRGVGFRLIGALDDTDRAEVAGP
jgi:DNA-binding response OmpR family regulator